MTPSILWLHLTVDVECKRHAPCSVDLIGQGDPSLRSVEQRNLAPGVLKLLSELKAVGGVPRYDFAGRHPHPQYVCSPKSDHGSLFPVAGSSLRALPEKRTLRSRVTQPLP